MADSTRHNFYGVVNSIKSVKQLHQYWSNVLFITAYLLKKYDIVSLKAFDTFSSCHIFPAIGILYLLFPGD